MMDADRGVVAAGGTGSDGWVQAVDRFAAWLADFSPYYRRLRTPIRVPDDAPAGLAYFWRTVGWMPGVGLGWDGGGIPPVRELGRAEADRAFRRWLGAECFAPTMRLPEATVQALWDQLPERCWVLRAGTSSYASRGGRCHGGSLFYVDEDAGDDPPLMEWLTSRADHEKGPVRPRVEAESSVAYLMGATLATIVRSYATLRTLPRPAAQGPFAPVFPHFWQLGDGVWGMPDPRYTSVGAILAEPAESAAVGAIIYSSPRAYLDYLAGLPASEVPESAFGAGMHAIDAADAENLAPRRLAGRGLNAVRRESGWTAVGRLEGIPILASQPGDDDDCGDVNFWVADEDYRAFADLLARENVDVCEHSRQTPAHWWVDPGETARAAVARQVERAEHPTDGAGRHDAGAPPRQVERGEAGTDEPGGQGVGAPPRQDAGVLPRAAADPAVEAAVRAEAAALRAWVLAANPGLELTTPELACDEPPLVRALWEQLGYTDEFGEQVGYPERAASENVLASLLEDYQSGGYECELDRSMLPQRLRVVWVDGDNDSSVMVTDEDAPVDDPPILGVSIEEGHVAPIDEFPSYIAWIGEKVAWYAGSGQSNWEIRTRPPLSGLGTRPYPHLAPGIRHLEPGIWADTGDGRSTVGAHRFRDLVAWIAQTTLVDRLELGAHYGNRQPAARIVLRRFTPPTGLREWRAPSGNGRCYAGLIDDVPVLVHDKRIMLTPHADRARAEALARAAGWL